MKCIKDRNDKIKRVNDVEADLSVRSRKYSYVSKNEFKKSFKEEIPVVETKVEKTISEKQRDKKKNKKITK